MELYASWCVASTSVAGMLATSAFSAGIVPDGATATSVATGASGQAIVTIAPAVSGVSHNTYADFNVGRVGADLLNTSPTNAARVIVNEVTSTNRSLIEGPISVVGKRANVILANPNGITVDGGSFVNTGSVALTTGKITFNDFLTAPGEMQRNVVLTTDRGAIEIGPGGLSGAFNKLELIAKQLRINGPVINAVSRADAHVRMVAGDSKAEVDTSISPTDNLNDWIAYDAPGTANAAVLVDITPLGSLTAGSIKVRVTDRGAGVRNAGALYANVGDFTLSATGELSLARGTIKSERHVVLADKLNADGTLDPIARLHIGDGAIDAKGEIQVYARGVDTAGGALRGASGVFIHADRLRAGVSSASGAGSELESVAGSIDLAITDDVTLEASNVAARDHVIVHAASFTQSNAGIFESRLSAVEGGVLIETTGHIQSIGSSIHGAQRIEGNDASEGAVTLHAGGSVLTASADSAAHPAVIYSGSGDVVIKAGGDIVNHNARLLASQDLRLEAGGDARNLVDRVDIIADGEEQTYWEDHRNWLGIHTRTHGFTVDYGHLEGAHTESYWKGGRDVIVSAQNVENRGGNIYTDEGDIRLTAQEKIINDALATGAAHFERRCRLIFCKTSAESSVEVHGGEISAARDVVMTAGSEVHNTGGRVLALNDMTLNAPSVVAEGVTGYSAISRLKGMKAWFGDTWAKIYAADVGGSFRANAGKLVVNGRGYVDAGSFNAAQGVEASGGIVEIRAPRRDPVELNGNHVGLTSWLFD